MTVLRLVQSRCQHRQRLVPEEHSMFHWGLDGTTDAEAVVGFGTRYEGTQQTEFSSNLQSDRAKILDGESSPTNPRTRLNRVSADGQRQTRLLPNPSQTHSGCRPSRPVPNTF
jgi:hypothetical protein